MIFAALLPTTPPRIELTVESVMKCVSQIGHPPRGLRWSADGKVLRFSWAKADGSADAPYKEYSVLKDGTKLTAGAPSNFVERTPEIRPEPKRTSEVYVEGGELYVRDLETKATRQFTTK